MNDTIWSVYGGVLRALVSVFTSYLASGKKSSSVSHTLCRECSTNSLKLNKKFPKLKTIVICHFCSVVIKQINKGKIKTQSWKKWKPESSPYEQYTSLSRNNFPNFHQKKVRINKDNKFPKIWIKIKKYYLGSISFKY